MTESRTYICVLCDWTGPIPDDAVQLTNGFAGRAIVYRFANGGVHSLKRIKKDEELTNGISNQG